MYGIESTFWLRLIFMIVIILLFFYIFELVMRKWLKVEKRSVFHITTSMTNTVKLIGRLE